jgi:hypothetical protein
VADQFYQLPDGRVVKALPQGGYQVVSGGGAVPVTGGNPKLPGELTTQSLDITGKSISNKKDAATLPFDVRKARADAETAEINAKNAQDQYNAQHPPVSTSGLYGADYLKTLSPADQATIRALDEGRLAFPMNAGMRSPFWQEKLSQVAQYDPTFDATNFNARAKARANAISGKLGQSNNALNTALGHLQTLSDQIDGTASHGGFPFATTVNAVENAYSRGRGDPGITNFNDTATKLADELEAVYRNGGGAEQGVVRQLRNLDPNMSRDQKVGVIHNAMDLLASKMAANLSQYNFGMSGKPEWEMLDPHAREIFEKNAPDIRDKYFAVAPGQSGGNPNGGGSGGTPNNPAGGPPIVRPPDFSGMVGGPAQNLATMDPNSPAGVFKQTYRNQYDPVMASTMSALIRKGVPYDTAATYAQSHGFNPPSQSDYAAAVAFAKNHHGATNVEASKSVPTTFGERLSSSPAAAFVAGAGSGAAAGLADVAGRTIAGPAWDANRQALAATNPGSDLAGNVAGGVAGLYGAGVGADALRLAPRARMLLGASKANTLGKFAPLATDVGYGATYGASESPDNPLGGAVGGALTAGPAGMAGRGGMRMAGRMIAPTGGNLAPLYQANPDFRPTIGQRLSASDSRFLRGLGMGEQAAESIPFTGGIQTSARTAATDQMQRGAFNQALGEVGKELPNGITKGPEAHAFMQRTFNKTYDDARSNMQFVADPQYAQDVGSWQNSRSAMALSDDQVNHVQSVIGKALKGRVQGNMMDGANYKSAASDLADVARRWSSNPSTAAQGAYLRDFVSIMDDAAKRASPPEAGQLLDAADRGYAKSVIIENAGKSAGGEPTEFSGKNLLRSVQNSDPSVRDRAFLRGQALMQDYATAASKLSPSLADSGTPQRLAWMKLGGTGEAAALGGLAAMGHPAALAPWALDTIANLPGVRSAVGAAMAPRGNSLVGNTANMLGRGLYNRANTVGMFGAPLALDYYGQ